LTDLPLWHYIARDDVEHAGSLPKGLGNPLHFALPTSTAKVNGSTDFFTPCIYFDVFDASK
jgi:hypothetical protein